MENILVNSKVSSIRYEKKSIKDKYLAYCDAQMKQRVVWYLIPLISLSTVVMPIGIFAMSYFSAYIFFVGLSVLLFFANIIVNIAEQHTRITISVYILTILFHFILPLIAYLIS